MSGETISIVEMRPCLGKCGALRRGHGYCDGCQRLYNFYLQSEQEETAARREQQLHRTFAGLPGPMDQGITPMKRAAERLVLPSLWLASAVMMLLTAIGAYTVWQWLAR